MEDPARSLTDDLRFPGYGMPPRESDLRAGVRASRWARLTQNQPTGGRAVILYDNAITDPQVAGTPFFDFGGDDHDAEQLQIVIDSPRVIERSFASLEGEPIQNLSGEYGNIEVSSDNFPGTAAPIKWPPLSVLLEFGTLTRTRMIVDIVNGARINVSASWARAYAVITDDAANQPGTSAAYALRAFATPGWPTSTLARRTVWLGPLDDLADSSVFAVPPFADRVTLVGCDPAAGVPAVTVGYLRFWQSPDGAASAHNVGNYIVSGNQPGPFSVPNGAQYFSVTPQIGANGIRFAAIFDLA